MKAETLNWHACDLEGSVSARFERVAARFPEKSAIRSGTEAVTYDALNRAANRVAHAAMGRASSQQPIAVLLEHGASPVLAILGVLKAGTFYIALNPSHPCSHLQNILANAGAGLIVTNNRNLDLARELAADESGILNIDTIPGEVPDSNLRISSEAEEHFGLFYTSGSAGQPKGILHNHRHILHRAMILAEAYRLGPTDRIPLVISCTWLWSVTPIFGTLLNGGTVYPYDLSRSGVRGLLDLLVAEEITVLGVLPSVFRQIADLLTSEASGQGGPPLTSLRLLSLGTEPVYGSDVALWRSILQPTCIVANVLACSEAGIVAWDFFDISRSVQSGTLPVGRAAPGVELELMDEDGRPVASGEVGEIIVRSPYLFAGYWKRTDLTRAVLRSDLDGSDSAWYATGDLGFLQEDGRLVVTGRKDRQVKIRGNTVQPADVEMVLLDHPMIREAVVTTHTPHHGPQLVAYLVGDGDTRPSVGELRTYLKGLIPEFAIPAVFHHVDSLPRTPHGKLDVHALPAPNMERSNRDSPFISPRGGLEGELASIWSKALDLVRVGAEDDFFELGGDSLLASRLCLDIEARLGMTVTPLMLAEAPTISQLAAAIRRGKKAATHGSIVPLRQGGTLPPLFFVHGIGGGVLDYIPVIRHLEPGRPVFGLATDHLDFAARQSKSFEGLAAAYVNDILSFRAESPLLLAGYSYGGIVAFEIARQLAIQGHRIAMLGLIDCPAPGGDYFSFPLSRTSVTGFLTNLPRWVKAFVQPGPAAMLDHGRRKTRATLKRLRARLGHDDGTSSFIEALDLSRASDDKIAFMHQQSRLLADYEPGGYSGPVTLFRASTQPLFCSFSPDMGWEPLVEKGLEITEIAGTHHDLLSRRADSLAEELQKTLDRT